VDVRLDASFARRDLEVDGIDLAIRYADPRHAEGDKLFDEEVIPVCSPVLLAPEQPALRVPADLARHTLLRMEDHVGAGPLADWHPWLVSMGVPDLQPAAVLTFTNYDDVINAALHGQGVAMGRRPLVDRLLAEGRLVCPLAGALDSERAFHVVLAAGPAGQRAPVQAFRRWLLAEAKASGGAHAAALAL
jgi:DNA-binding transcriptional LysR family regulator